MHELQKVQKHTGGVVFFCSKTTTAESAKSHLLQFLQSDFQRITEKELQKVRIFILWRVFAG